MNSYNGNGVSSSEKNTFTHREQRKDNTFQISGASNEDNENYMEAADLLNTRSSMDWDLLLNRGASNEATVAASKWERESLYQKFDPLVHHKLENRSGQNQDAANANMLKQCQVNARDSKCGGDSTRSKQSAPENSIFIKPLAMPLSKPTTTHSHQGISRAQVHEPGGSISNTQHSTNQNHNMDDETFISASEFKGTMDTSEWDLLVGRGTGSIVNANTKWERESLYQKFDPLVSARKEITPTHGPDDNKIRRPVKEQIIESESEYRSNGSQNGQSDELEIKKLKDALELQAKNFQNQLIERSLQLKQLEATIVEASKKLENQQQSNRVLREYEKSVAALEHEIDQVKKSILHAENDRIKIVEERDHAVQDLRQAEFAFSDLHGKYEKVKNIVGNFKKNEEVLDHRHEEMKTKLERRDAKLKCLQDTVEDVFGKMKSDFESSIKSEEIENNRMRAQLRKLELRMSTIQKDLEQKDKQNQQLSLLCDDLIKGQAAK